MLQPPTPAIRDILIAQIQKAEENSKRPSGLTLQQGAVLQAAANELTTPRPGMQSPQGLSPELEQALLTEWGELFRTGLLAWGLNLSNPNPPFFHLTERGRNALANATRDPSNPYGYLRHLDAKARLNPIAQSYLVEGLNCYVAGLVKASGVMVGAAAESLILELVEVTRQRLTSLGKTVPKSLDDWRLKVLADGLQILLDKEKGALPRELREAFEAYWPAFIQQIRSVRNDAGHPTSVAPLA